MSINLNLLAESVNKYLVTPLNAFGLGGFVFDIEGESSVSLNADITDHYLEDNSAVQDHIAIRPKKVTLKSYVGELVYREDESTETAVQKAVQKLTTLSAYQPPLAAAAQQAINAIGNAKLKDFSLDNITLETFNKTTDYWAFVKNLGQSVSRQQRAYMYFKALMEGKFLVSVQTPFEFMNNMAVESITAIQGEDSKFISDFSITLKEIRTVSILSAPVDAGRYITRDATPEELAQGRSARQIQPLQNIGKTNGLHTKESISDAQLDAMFSDYLPGGVLGKKIVPRDPVFLTVDDLIVKGKGQ